MTKSSDMKQTGVPIELDKTRHLVFDLNAFCDLEERYDDVFTAMDKISNKPKFSDIRFILYVALRQEDENLTEKQTGKLITLKNVDKVVDAIAKAINEAMPEADGNEEKN